MLTGYSDRLSARPGETVSFMVSTDAPTFRVEIVRLLHGDTDPRGPGLRETRIPWAGDGEYLGSEQPFFPGSYVEVADAVSLRLGGDFTIFAWVYPTLIGKGRQTILSKQGKNGAGYSFDLSEEGCLSLDIGGEKLTGATPLQERRWQWIAATHEAASGLTRLSGGLHPRDLSYIGEICAQGTLPHVAASEATFLIAAAMGEQRPARFFNGKISDPCLFGRCLSVDEIGALVRCIDMSALPPACLAAWDFGVTADSDRVMEVTGGELHGSATQSPVRAMTGPHWTGDGDDHRTDPRGYAAIHFHEDSLADAGWRESFSLTIPTGLESGVYAARLRAGDETDSLPFFVSPPAGEATAELALLIPTFTYLAYGNELWGEYGLNCVYDRYVDGAGVPYASARHPTKTFRPERGLLASVTGERFARHLCADLYLVDWLNAVGQKVDIVTDHELHREGGGLLRRYKAVATGSHPEYVSGRMLDAFEDYLGEGGSLAYFGGNGFYTVTTLSDDGSMIEVRRPNGTRPWTAAPGEGRHSMTGETGGLWRARSRAPQRLVGVGFSAQGWTSRNQCGLPRPHRQVGDRTDPLVADLMQGIGPDETIGDFLTLGLGVGAAGDEIDRTDPVLGTPAQTRVLATATGFSTDYQLVIDERRDMNEASTYAGHPDVRSDIVCFETPAGGLVFSVGTMQWFSALSHDGYDNNVATLTRNVLARMLR